jgi:hypothetical protein
MAGPFDNEVAYDIAGDLSSRLADVWRELHETNSQRRLLYFGALQLVAAHFEKLSGQTTEPEVYGHVVGMAVRTARLLLAVVDQDIAAHKQQARAAESMPSNSGPLVGDESVDLSADAAADIYREDQ